MIMNKNMKITVFSQIYNTPAVMLRRCIESVLHQSYENFEFLIIDNGSTDDTKHILEEYRDLDPRIHLTRFEDNKIGYRAVKFAANTATGEYITNIDSDDWFESDFLESMLTFVCENELDIAATGSYFVDEDGKLLGKRNLPNKLILPSAQFAESYPYYHAFYRTIWGKFVRTCIFQHYHYDDIQIKYGGDTYCAFLWLRAASRMGVTNQILHHYTIRKNSSSYLYDPARFDSDITLYHHAVDFLSSYGPVSSKNQKFITIVYANAIQDTLNVIANSSLASAEKLLEYRHIATYPLTVSAYRWKDPAIANSRHFLLICACNTVLQLPSDTENENFKAIVQGLCPKCSIAATRQALPLLLNKALQEPFLLDDLDTLAEQLLKISLYASDDLSLQILSKLAIHKPMLVWMEDIQFPRYYPAIYWHVWQERYKEALEKMIDLVQNGAIQHSQETFYQLFINLSAKLGQENAFIFGKIQLAWFYFTQHRFKPCKTLVTELEEMGLQEDESILSLRQALDTDI